jgi:hypothetical protein
MAHDSTTEVPLSLCQVLEEEYELLHGPLPANHREITDPETRLAAIYQLIHTLPDHERRAALCISGGGIRSATFGLGVLQGLASYNLLDKFHYLSTVSGGGYIGSWLTAWIHRHAQGAQGVLRELTSFRPSKIDPEHEPVRRLREYSNYLTPNFGFLSADTWTWIAIYLRNLLLNWLVLIPLLAAVLVIPLLSVEIVRLPPDASSSGLQWVYYVLASALFIIGVAAVWRSIHYIDQNLPMAGRNNDQDSFLWRCLLPLLASSITLTTAWAWYANMHSKSPAVPGWWWFSVVGALLHLAGCSKSLFAVRRNAPSAPGAFRLVVPILAAGGVGGALVGICLNTAIFLRPTAYAASYVWLAFPLLLVLFLVATTVYVGLASYQTSDADREWWARAGGWILIGIVAWMAVSGLVIFGPELVLGRGRLLQQGVAALGGISGLITIVLGKSSLTPANKKQEAKASWTQIITDNAAIVAAPVFAAFIVIVLAFGLQWLLSKLAVPLAPLLSLLIGFGLLVVLVLVALVMGFFINVNKFSLHAAYRDRLIRAYLGASRQKRNPNRFIGFDPADNLPMYELQQGQGTKKFERPLHVINMTLNLVKGENLAWQERKAESFTASPLHAGSYRLGYRRSTLYGGTQGLDGGDGISLGTAMAISGAAASPNAGYHSSPVVTFLMALFNVRLGWWLGNPGSKGARTFRRRGPTFAVRPLIEETLGLTTDTNPYVYLSDGGHFDNLGFYEMVLRRCHVIVVSDAGCDPKCELDDLGGAVRKVRADLGVPIEFTTGFHIYARGNQVGRRCAVGIIRYSVVDGKEAKDGILIYLKPCFYNVNEPMDVINHASINQTFPHESTNDQWFSESQFESYRMLGHHTIDEICGAPGQSMTLNGLITAAIATAVLPTRSA